MNEPSYQEFTFLGPNSHLKGEFRLTGNIQLSSCVEGKLTIDSGKLTIEKRGFFRGDLECQDLEVFGEIDGTIRAQGKVIVQPSSRIRGKLWAKSLVIYPGGQLNIEGHTLEN